MKSVLDQHSRALLLPLVLALLLLLPCAAPAASRRTAVVEAVEKAGPAVVNIRTEQIVKRRASPWFGFGDSFFNDFFRDLSPPRTFRTQSLGSGVIIDSLGLILTNAHVIEKASKIYVALPGARREVEATLVGIDERIDLAVIRIVGGEPYPHLPLGRSDDLLLGETVIAIGNPLGLGNSVTTGVISAPRRRLSLEEGVVSVFIQSDALINPGNSGGPLININGELIGINTAIAQQAQGIGFSIPCEVIHRVLGDLIDYGGVRPAFTGIIPGNIARALARSRGIGGVLVTEVDPGSPAAAAGLALADVILALDDVAVESPDEYRSVLGSYTPKDRVKVAFLRGTEELEVSLVLGAIPENYGLGYGERLFGFSVEERGEGLTVASVTSNSPAEKVGLHRGDLVAEVGGERVTTRQEYSRALEKRLGEIPVPLLIVRNQQGYYVELP